MFLTTITRALYKTNWSLNRMIVNIERETQLSWTSTMLCLTTDGMKDVRIYFNSNEDLEKEVKNIVHKINEIDKNESSDKMIYHLQMREAERKLKAGE